MKNTAFLIGGIFLFFSCVNEDSKGDIKEELKTEEVTAKPSDSLPEAKWNGEYMKIDDGDEPKIKRKSQGSDFYNMGDVKLKIGDVLVEFKLFERKKNSLTFTNHSISAIIKSAFGEDLHVYFKKNDIIVNHKGNYKADPSGNTNNSFRMNITAGEGDQKEEYILNSGEAELVQFSPRLGTLELKVNGIFSSKNSSQQKGGGTIKMRFENAVMTAN